VVVVGASLAVGTALREARSGASFAPTASPDTANALSAAAPVASAASGDCVQLGRVASRIGPPLAVVDGHAGTKRITSAEGGYSLTVPQSWLVTGGPFAQNSFAQTHVSSYDPKTAPTPDPERWMLPAAVGISFDVQVWLNSDQVSPERFADNIHIGPDQVSKADGAAMTIDGLAAYRFVINDVHRFQPADRPLVVTRQTRIVWLVQSREVDRVIVAFATPGESSLLATVESAVRQMSIAPAFVSERPVTLQRSEILKQWLNDKSGGVIAGRHVEAKLMTYFEANSAMNGPVPPGGPKPIQLLRLDHDPDDLYWLVAVAGPDLPQPRGGPYREMAPSGTPAPTAWMLYDTSATGQDLGGTGMRLATQGSWPPGYDALPDRCR
jgi:hypothetical protein